MAGVRIYARQKIVATTRDFEQPAGFTGEFAIGSHLVGEVHAEWLDADDGDDLIRTDRQSIIWDSEYGEALRAWGANLIREIGNKSKAPRRIRKSDLFMSASKLREKADERFADEAIIVGLFGKTRVEELASYAQIAVERVEAVGRLEDAPTSPGRRPI
jgi:hypothetical protein